jgi:hypothetical protein
MSHTASMLIRTPYYTEGCLRAGPSSYSLGMLRTSYNVEEQGIQKVTHVELLLVIPLLYSKKDLRRLCT